MKPSIKQMGELLRLRSILQEISQISMSFSVINKRYPIHDVTVQQADDLISEYRTLLKRATIALEAQTYGEQNTTT